MCVRFRNGRLHASTIARSPRWRSDQIQVVFRVRSENRDGGRAELAHQGLQ